MKMRMILLAIFITLLPIEHPFTQNNFFLELNGGAAFALDDPADTEVKTGLAFEGLLAYQVHSMVALYGGWGWTQFSSENSILGSTIDFEETGYRLGLEFNNKVGAGLLGYYVRAAALFNHIEVENEDGDTIGDSDHGLGFQAGLGMTIDLGSSIQIRPGLRYQSLSREIEYDSIFTVKDDIDLSYLSVGLGIVIGI